MEIDWNDPPAEEVRRGEPWLVAVPKPRSGQVR